MCTFSITDLFPYYLHPVRHEMKGRTVITDGRAKLFIEVASSHRDLKGHLNTCNTEIGKDAILFVLVALVGLETLALAVVPQLECVVQGSR